MGAPCLSLEGRVAIVTVDRQLASCWHLHCYRGAFVHLRFNTEATIN